MLKAIVILTLLIPSIKELKNCEGAVRLTGAAVYCCALKSGQQCCSKTASNGIPTGCMCQKPTTPKPTNKPKAEK